MEGCNGCNQELNLCECQDGKNSWTITTANFTMPAVYPGSVVIPVSNVGQYSGSWATLGQIIYVTNAGYFGVVSSTPTSITALNLEDISPGQYVSNVPPTTIIPSGSKVSPSGLQGLPGINGQNGKTLLGIDYTLHTNSNPAGPVGGFTIQQTYTIPAGVAFTQVQDSIEIEVILSNQASSTVSQYAVAIEDGVSSYILASAVFVNAVQADQAVKLNITVTRADVNSPGLVYDKFTWVTGIVLFSNVFMATGIPTDIIEVPIANIIFTNPIDIVIKTKPLAGGTIDVLYSKLMLNNLI